MTPEPILRRRIKWLTWFFIIGLFLSGVTAIPLNQELDLLVKWFGLDGQTSATATSELGRWLLTAREALQDITVKHPLLFYGTDWLAFGHFVIAIAFIGALRDPVRNRWLFDFGLIACVLVIPYALVFGAVRGIPVWWRLIDCSFGVFGFVPLWFCRKWAREIGNIASQFPHPGLESNMIDPITIYRFLGSAAALKTIEARQFRVGRLSNFNDPFEWQLGGTGATLEEKACFDQYRRGHAAWSDGWMGILCFSDCVSNPVLWSLYAEKHQGVAFELKHPWKGDDLHKMTYSNERPLLDFTKLRELRDDQERDEYLKALLQDLSYRKSLGWAFEQEYRMSVDLNNPKHCLLLPDGWHHWQIPDNCLKRVILGFRCPLEEAAIRKLLDMNGLVDTKIVRAEMCSETYAIKC